MLKNILKKLALDLFLLATVIAEYLKQPQRSQELTYLRKLL